MDKLVRSTLVKIIAALDDSEFADLVQEARGEAEPSAADYRQLVDQLTGETLVDKQVKASQALYDHVHGGQKG